MIHITLSILTVGLCLVLCLWRIGTKLDALTQLKPVVMRGQNGSAPSPQQQDEAHKAIVEALKKIKAKKDQKRQSMTDPGSNVRTDTHGRPAYRPNWGE